MVATAIQARDVEAGLTEAVGEHVPATHEALLLAYEMSFVHVDPETGRQYLLSTDIPWIGKRTNDPDGEHVALLAAVANPVGVKLGSDATAEDILAYQERLNPEGTPGKLIFMLRIGQDAEALHTVLDAIKAHAPESVVMYDLHGSTRVAADGKTKIRCVVDIIEEIKTAAMACRAAGLKLHGLHLETTTDDSRLECVDEPNQMPTDYGSVDPQLNPAQTIRILKEVAEYLL
jgi:3-deoxy-7-phosphoheptulonate synthase